MQRTTLTVKGTEFTIQLPESIPDLTEHEGDLPLLALYTEHKIKEARKTATAMLKEGAPEEAIQEAIDTCSLIPAQVQKKLAKIKEMTNRLNTPELGEYLRWLNMYVHGESKQLL